MSDFFAPKVVPQKKPDSGALRRNQGRVVDMSAKEIFLEPGKETDRRNNPPEQRAAKVTDNIRSSGMAAVLNDDTPPNANRPSIKVSDKGRGTFKLGGELSADESRMKLSKDFSKRPAPRNPIFNENVEAEARDQEKLEKRREALAKNKAQRENVMLVDEDDHELQARSVEQYHRQKEQEAMGDKRIPKTFQSSIQVTANGLCAAATASDPRFNDNLPMRPTRPQDASKIHYEDELDRKPLRNEAPVGSAKQRIVPKPKASGHLSSDDFRSAFNWDGNSRDTEVVEPKRGMVGKPHDWEGFAPVSRRDERYSNLGKGQRFNNDHRPRDESDIFNRAPAPEGKPVRQHGGKEVTQVMTWNTEPSTPAPPPPQREPRYQQQQARNPITGDGHDLMQHKISVNTRARPTDTGKDVLFLQPPIDEPKSMSHDPWVVAQPRASSSSHGHSSNNNSSNNYQGNHNNARAGSASASHSQRAAGGGNSNAYSLDSTRQTERASARYY